MSKAQQNPIIFKIALLKPSSLLTRHPNTLAFLFFLLITATFLHPVIFNFFDEVSGAGDTYEYVWRLWWFKHTLIDTGQSIWFVPFIYYPQGYLLAYSEVTPVNTLVGLPFTIALGEYSAHNTLLFLSIFLTGFNTFLLARQLTGNIWAGILAGVLFTFTPYRRGQYFHLIHLSIQWFPLIFLFLERFLRTRQRLYAFAGGVAFGLNALASWYLAVAAGLLGAVWMAARARPWSSYLRQRHIWTGLFIFSITASALISPFLFPSLAALKDPDTFPPLDNANFWSASPTDYLIPNPFHPIWGTWVEENLIPLATLVDKEAPSQADFEAGNFFPNSNLNISTEFLMSPGLVALLFVIYSLRWVSTTAIKPWLYLLIVSIILSLGPTLHWAGRQVVIPTPPAVTDDFNDSMNYISTHLSLQREPFTIKQNTGLVIPLPALLLRWFVPGLGNARTWTRFGQFAIFSAAILAAYGAAAWHTREIARPHGQRSGKSKNLHLPWLIVIGLALFELWWKPMPTHVPSTARPVDIWLRQQASHNRITRDSWQGDYCDNTNARRQPDNDAIIQYPLASSFNGSQFIYTRAHCKPIVHGYGNPFGFMFGRRHPELLTFPSTASLALLSGWQVRYVLIETTGPGTSTAQELLQKVAAVPCLHPATVQVSIHVFELVDCDQTQ